MKGISPSVNIKQNDYWYIHFGSVIQLSSSELVDPLPLDNYGVEHWGHSHVEWEKVDQLARLKIQQSVAISHYTFMFSGGVHSDCGTRY